MFIFRLWPPSVGGPKIYRAKAKISRTSKAISSGARPKYIVKQGDTVESIAQFQLGNAAFAELIVIINRADINVRLLPDGSPASLNNGLILRLPTEEELEIYRYHFGTGNVRTPSMKGGNEPKTVIDPKSVFRPDWIKTPFNFEI
jgi:hypothetical protein